MPDIILADYSMPQWNASRALVLLKNLGLDIPFIVVSARSAKILPSNVSSQAPRITCSKTG